MASLQTNTLQIPSKVDRWELISQIIWEPHLLTGKKAVLMSVRKQIGALSSLRNSLSAKGKLHLANALVMSCLSYLICIWGNTTDTLVKKAQIVHNIAARFVTGKNRSTKQSELIADCNWLNITELTKCHSLMQLWKTTHWKKPDYLWRRIQEEVFCPLTIRVWRWLRLHFDAKQYYNGT